MKHNTLFELISAIEYGTNLHICVVFLSHFGNVKTQLPHTHYIHSKPVCAAIAKTKEGMESCFRCRNTVLKYCIRHKKSLDGFCIKGVYEYCRPIIYNSNVVAVVLIGNIFTDNQLQYTTLCKYVDVSLLNTMQSGVEKKDCERIADLVESYIQFLLEKYGYTSKNPTDMLIDNICNYIIENQMMDFTISDVAKIFNYNAKYLGRLFKAAKGVTINEFCNIKRIEYAKQLLNKKDIKISEVAIQSGFNDITYFNRVFKQITGVSPKEYRRE